MANMALTRDFAEYMNIMTLGLERAIDRKDFDPECQADVMAAAIIKLVSEKLPFDKLTGMADKCLKEYGQTVSVPGMGRVTVDGKEKAVVDWAEFKKAFGKDVSQVVFDAYVEAFDPSIRFIRSALGSEMCKDLGIPSKPKGTEKHKNEAGEVHQYMKLVEASPSVEAFPL